MSDIAKRLGASIKYDALNGDKFEQDVVRKQIVEAIGYISELETALDVAVEKTPILRFADEWPHNRRKQWLIDEAKRRVG